MPAALGLRAEATVQVDIERHFQRGKDRTKNYSYFSRRLAEEGTIFQSFSVYLAAKMALLGSGYQQCFSHSALPHQFG